MSNEITLEQVYDAVLGLAQATGNMDVRITGEFKVVNRRLDGVETRLTGVETRLGNVENRVEGLEGKVDDLGVRVGSLERGIGELTTVVRSVDRRLSVVEAR